MTANLELPTGQDEAFPEPRHDFVDLDLVQRAIEGDRDAFEELYRQNATSIFNLALRSTREPESAHDVCQEVWLKVHRQISTLRAPAAFPAWLRRIAAHACVDMARQKARVRRDVCDSDASEVPDRTDLEEDVAEDEDRRLAWQALAGLAPRQSAALYLREVEGLDYQRIGAAIDASPSAVETLLFRARRSLARSYGTLKDSRTERCNRARGVIAAFVDDECTPVEQRALHAHLEGCAECRAELYTAQEGNRRYAVLPLIPVAGAPLSFVREAAPSIPHLLGLLLAKLKALLMPSVVATGVTAGAVGMSVLPTPPLPFDLPNAGPAIARQAPVRDTLPAAPSTALSALSVGAGAVQAEDSSTSEDATVAAALSPSLSQPTLSPPVLSAGAAMMPMPPAQPEAQMALAAPVTEPLPATQAVTPSPAVPSAPPSASIPSVPAAPPPALPVGAPPQLDGLTEWINEYVAQQLAGLGPQHSQGITQAIAQSLEGVLAPSLAQAQTSIDNAYLQVQAALASIPQTIAQALAPAQQTFNQTLQAYFPGYVPPAATQQPPAATTTQPTATGAPTAPAAGAPASGLNIAAMVQTALAQSGAAGAPPAGQQPGLPLAVQIRQAIQNATAGLLGPQ